jgi:undecaprenyl-diphosphatase
MKKKYLILALLLLISLIFDKQILNFVIGLRIAPLNNFMIQLDYLSSEFIVAGIAVLFFLFKKTKRKLLIPLLSSFAAVAIVTFSLKYLIMRPRPIFDSLLSPTSPSFPSGHASFIFTPLVFFNKEYPSLKWAWLFLAIMVAFSRLYLGVHYLSDVIVGAIIGIGIGNFFIYSNSKYNISKKIKRWFKK